MSELQIKERRVAAFMDEAADRIAEARKVYAVDGSHEASIELYDTARALIRAAAREAAGFSRIHWLRVELDEMARQIGIRDLFGTTTTRAVA